MRVRGLPFIITEAGIRTRPSKRNSKVGTSNSPTHLLLCRGVCGMHISYLYIESKKVLSLVSPCPNLPLLTSVCRLGMAWPVSSPLHHHSTG